MAGGLEKQIIARALEIIREQGHWTREALARSSKNHPCSWSDLAGMQFCAVGALNRAAGEIVKGWGCATAIEAEKFVLAANDRSGDDLAKINDEEGHEVIVEMFKKALAS